MRLDSATAFEPLLDTRMVESNPRFSSNGRWVAYQSNRSGRREIWVAPQPNPAGRWQQISVDGGADPRWSRNGRELFYRNGDKMMVVRVDTGSVFHAERPTLLFRGNYLNDYDVSPDGNRFVMIKPDDHVMRSASDPDRDLHVVVNWFTELQQRVPTR